MKIIAWIRGWRPVPLWWYLLNQAIWLAMLLWLAYVIAEEKGLL